MKKIQRFLRGTALLAVLSLLVSATAFAGHRRCFDGAVRL